VISFEQSGISLPQGCTMLNSKALWPVVHEKKFLKIYQNFPDFALFWFPNIPLFEQI